MYFSFYSHSSIFFLFSSVPKWFFPFASSTCSLSSSSTYELYISPPFLHLTFLPYSVTCINQRMWKKNIVDSLTLFIFSILFMTTFFSVPPLHYFHFLLSHSSHFYYTLSFYILIYFLLFRFPFFHSTYFLLLNCDNKIYKYLLLADEDTRVYIYSRRLI